MPPGGGKRKRPERNHTEDDSTRPSPYRPGNPEFGRQSQPQSPVNIRDGQENRTQSYSKNSRSGKTIDPISPLPAASSKVSTAAPTNSASVAPHISKPDPASLTTDHPQAMSATKPFSYTLIESTTRQSWDNEGREAVRQLALVAAEKKDEIQIITLIQELLQAACTDVLPARDAGEVLKEILKPVAGVTISVAQRALLDSISISFEESPALPSGPLIQFLIATGIEEDMLRHELDQALLLKLGLISSRFKQMGIRKQTNTLYRQANFNLMREESEGFAKLITELFITSGNESPTGEVVHETVERVRAMIGAFDLDVGRSLDVILDVFGSVLVRHFRFLVRLLRASPWWPPKQDEQEGAEEVSSGLPKWALPSSSDYQLSDTDKEKLQRTNLERDTSFWSQARAQGLLAFQQIGLVRASEQVVESAKASKSDTADEWIAATGTLPPSGNRDAAQLLGFKLRFYSSSAARGPNDSLPDNLIHLSALLIKIGFISLNDLYPHIWRSDDEMGDLQEQKMKEKVERERAARPGAGVKNALAMAGALADDTLPAPVTRLRESTTRSGTPVREEDAEKPVTKDGPTEPADQKVMLLKSLLAIGALPEALFILGRFPWIIDLYPELPEYIHRILHHCLGEVYETLRPLESRPSLKNLKPIAETDVPGVSKGQVKLTEISLKKTLKWAGLDRNDSGDGTDYRFYWDDWNDNIPVCRTVDDVFTLCSTILPLVGVKIGQDPTLILKFTRIGKRSLLDDPSDPNKKRWLDLIKRVLLPCLSLTKSNAGVVNEVFELISQYPTTTRYIMYLEWSSGRTSRKPDIAAAFDQAKAETKDILKRISKTNVKPMARSLAKVAYANPHIVITTALTQIESYDSIAEVFVEGARYFTDLGYDVLTWAVISSMGRAGRNRTQDGGMFASRWLTALSSFAGKIYKRYSMMKVGPVLQYVGEQLERGNSTDLKMLEQLVVSMAGIATDTNFNDAQLQAMGGGPLLQSQTILQLLDRRNESKTTSKRLVKALQDHGLTAKLLVLMAQQRESCVFEENNVPLKAIGNTYDEISRVMVQYLDLLRSILTTDEFQLTIPDVTQLLVEYELPADLAFGIGRPIIAKRMSEVNKEQAEAKKTNGIKSTNGDVEMEDHEASEEDGEAIETDDLATAATPSEFGVNSAADMDGTLSEESLHKWHPVLKPIMDALQDHLPSELVDVIGVGFYVTFWQLSLYDISVPSKSYEDEMNRQRKRITALTSDRSNVSVTAARQRENNIKQQQQVIDELLRENKHHLKAFSESRSRLSREKDQWFANKHRNSDQIISAMMEYCFLPRILSSPLDAYFCFKFVKYLHSNGTASFRTLGFYESFLKPQRLASLFFMCTSKESDNLGRFLRELLQDLGRWHKDQSGYEREAFGSKRDLIGFAMKVENGKPQKHLDFEMFRSLLFKWHSNVYVALTKSLSSTEYMHLRNAISILRAISPVYPAVNFHGTQLQKAVDKLRTSDRDDVKVAAGALLGALSRREKEWVVPQAFRQGKDKLGHSERSTPRSEGRPESKLSLKDDPQGFNDMKDVGSVDVRRERVKAEPRERSYGTPRINDSVKDIPRPTSTAGLGPASRLESDTGYTDRRSTRPSDQSKLHNLPPKVSTATRHQPPANLPSRPDIDTRNGYRDSPRLSSRSLPVEPPRSDSRSGYARPGLVDRGQEPPYDPSHRAPRTHDRPSMLDRDDRSHRREYEPRIGHEERRQPDRDPRIERESRIDREHRRGPEPDSRASEREHGRLQHDPDRKRPDLLDERRTTPAAPSRMASSQSIPPGVNPERAALINAEPRSDMSIRGQAQDKPRGSRPSSPRRDDDRRHQSRQERDDRSERRTEPVTRSTPVSTQQQQSRPSSTNFNREPRQHNPPVDLRHGRLEPESPQRSSQRSERPVEPEVPSGPRNRAPAAPKGRTQAVTTPAPSSGSERPTPTGPSGHTRNNSTQDPAAGSKTQDTAGVHPDRMNRIAGDAPRGPQRPNLNTQGPPSGPRNAAPPPSGPSPVTRAPPTGPQMDGNGRGRNRNPLDTLNSTLAQAQGPPQGRGRGNIRQSGNQLPPQMPPPGPAQRSQFGQADQSNPNDVPVQPRPNSGRRDSAKDVRSEEDGRSSRNQHREGRDDRRMDDQSRRSEKREETSHEQRSSRNGQSENLSARKHPREDGGHYGGYPRGGSRNASENKRPRRGG